MDNNDEITREGDAQAGGEGRSERLVLLELETALAYREHYGARSTSPLIEQMRADNERDITELLDELVVLCAGHSGAEPPAGALESRFGRPGDLGPRPLDDKELASWRATLASGNCAPGPRGERLLATIDFLKARLHGALGRLYEAEQQLKVVEAVIDHLSVFDLERAPDDEEGLEVARRTIEEVELLRLRAEDGPLERDVSDHGWEWRSGFLSGQINALNVLIARVVEL